jgi:hypothetical protein
MNNGKEEQRLTAIRSTLARAAETVRLEGEIVYQNAEGIAVLWGEAVFEVEADQVVEVRAKEGRQVEIILRADALLLRTTLVDASKVSRGDARRVQDFGVTPPISVVNTNNI